VNSVPENQQGVKLLTGFANVEAGELWEVAYSPNKEDQGYITFVLVCTVNNAQ
jgi:hypothetical protein